MAEVVLSGLDMFDSGMSNWRQAKEALASSQDNDDVNMWERGVVTMSAMGRAMDVAHLYWLPAAWKQAWGILGKRVCSWTKTLRDVIPAWNVYVTARKYNATLARKHLMDNGIVNRLLQNQNKLFTLTSSISSIVAEKKMKLILEEELDEVDAALEYATETMSVIAAVAVVEGKDENGDRSAKAKKLLSEKSIPESLRAELRKLVIPE